MTFCANAIITPTSAASMGFRLPETGPLAAAPPVSPNPENNTLPSERFIALAINCVSSVPAEPTTVPAMIIAALFSTNPSKATANPVKALYREMTTGMSAPPIGSVMVIPSTSASANSAVTCPGSCSPAPMCAVTIPPSSSVAARMTRLMTCCPEKRRLRLISPCSLPKAIALPLKEIAPMIPPTTASVVTA